MFNYHFVKFYPGDHISEAAKRLIENAPAKGIFNEIEIIAEVGDTVETVVDRWQIALVERTAKYKQSPEYKEAEEKRNQEINILQKQYDYLLERLPLLDFSNDVEVLNWIADIQESTDHIGVVGRSDYILDIFQKNGFVINANCYDAFDGENRDNFFRYIVGQALSGINYVGAIHSMVHNSIGKWKKKFLNETHVQIL